MLRRLAVLSVLTAAAAACVLDADGFSNGSPSSDGDGGNDGASPVTPVPDSSSVDDSSSVLSDASSSDAADVHVDSAADAGVDSGADSGTPNPNVLTNPGFETGCGQWSTGSNATITPSTDARTGQKSCKVCMTGANDAYVYSEVPVSLATGDRLLGDIWVKGDKGAPIGEFQFFLNYTGTQDDFDGPATWLQPSTGAWSRMSAIEDIGAPAIKAAVVLVFDNNDGKCVLIDDASLRALP